MIKHERKGVQLRVLQPLSFSCPEICLPSASNLSDPSLACLKSCQPCNVCTLQSSTVPVEHYDIDSGGARDFNIMVFHRPAFNSYSVVARATSISCMVFHSQHLFLTLWCRARLQ